jgi:hypothetical protein
MEGLTEKQLLAVINLVAGKTRLETAEICGVDESTIFRWYGEPKFANWLNDTRRIVYQNALESLKDSAEDAIRNLRLICNDSDASASARVSAASAILSNCFKAIEQTEIQNRLEALQRQLEILGEK